MQVLHEERLAAANEDVLDEVCTSPAPVVVAPQILKLTTAPSSALEPMWTVDGTL